MTAVTVNQLGVGVSPFANAPGGKMPDFLIPAESSLPLAPPPIPLETLTSADNIEIVENSDGIVYTAVHSEVEGREPSRMYVPLDSVVISPAPEDDGNDTAPKKTWSITEIMSNSDTNDLFPFWSKREKNNKWRLPSQIHAVKISSEDDNLHTWIPGISTPEGIVLVTGVAAAAGLSVAEGVLLEHVFTAASTVIVTGITVGLPATVLSMFR